MGWSLVDHCGLELVDQSGPEMELASPAGVDFAFFWIGSAHDQSMSAPRGWIRLAREG